jgi:hypothetical protein
LANYQKTSLWVTFCFTHVSPKKSDVSPKFEKRCRMLHSPSSPNLSKKGSKNLKTPIHLRVLFNRKKAECRLEVRFSSGLKNCTI